jgi:hypothetical protein
MSAPTPCFHSALHVRMIRRTRGAPLRLLRYRVRDRVRDVREVT